VIESSLQTELIAPVVHLNGTAQEDLYEALSAACESLARAREAVQKTAPNGRDYYPHPVRYALTKALSQHDSRLARIGEVETELRTILETIC
jgi:hypothetical protein